MRIQLEMNDDRVREIEKLMDDRGIKTKKDLFNNALSLFEWALGEIKAGKIIASVDEKQDKYKQVIMPVLQ